jgi:aspartate kinase
LIVMKFGGTSLGSANRFREVFAIVRKSWQLGNTPVIVLSAMSGITNALISCANQAAKRNLDRTLKELKVIRQSHLILASELLATSSSQQDSLEGDLEPLFDQIEVLLRGVSYLGELSKRSLDAISGFGELLSSKSFAAFAQMEGLPATWMDARQFLITDEHFGAANPLWDELLPKAQTVLTPILKENRCIITQGFIGATTNGVSTTLGRGGSDYSASIIGVAMNASEIQIWTDVDGMMTADPRLVPDALALSEVSFQEASELAYFGAKVLHPLTIKPAVQKKIPVRILNTMKPKNTGTLITETPKELSSGLQICSIASKKGLTAIFINSPGMLMAYGFLAKVFEIFARCETPIDLIATSEVSTSLTIDSIDSLDKITESLSELGEVKVLHDVAIITVVGRQFRHKSGLAGHIFSALNDINIIMISGGASDINLSCVVSSEDADRAVRLLHKSLFADTLVSASI